MKKYTLNLSLVLLILQLSCVAQQSGINSSNDTYTEDLTLVRPVYESDDNDSIETQAAPVEQPQVLAATKTVNSKVDMVLDSLDKLNQLRRYVDGFTIQIYSGPKREDALGAKAKMVKAIGSELEADIQYTQPKFRVTVGKYFTKLEAQKDLMRLRDYFSNAILIPEKILIK
ncbi:MAG: SPOR domain-containing protein [Cyclobacteriaceae bacterium]